MNPRKRFAVIAAAVMAMTLGVGMANASVRHSIKGLLGGPRAIAAVTPAVDESPADDEGTDESQVDDTKGTHDVALDDPGDQGQDEQGDVPTQGDQGDQGQDEQSDVQTQDDQGDDPQGDGESEAAGGGSDTEDQSGDEQGQDDQSGDEQGQDDQGQDDQGQDDPQDEGGQD